MTLGTMADQNNNSEYTPAYIMLAGVIYNKNGKEEGISLIHMTPDQFAKVSKLPEEQQGKWLKREDRHGFGKKAKKQLLGKAGAVYKVNVKYDEQGNFKTLSLNDTKWISRWDNPFTRNLAEIDSAAWSSNRALAMQKKEAKMNLRDRMTWKEIKRTYSFMPTAKKAAFMQSLIKELLRS